MQLEIPDHLGIAEGQARLARAAALAGYSRMDFQRLLSDQGIPIAFAPEDLEHDLDILKQLDQLEHR